MLLPTASLAGMFTSQSGDQLVTSRQHRRCIIPQAVNTV